MLKLFRRKGDENIFTEFQDKFLFTICLNPKVPVWREREIGAENKDKNEFCLSLCNHILDSSSLSVHFFTQRETIFLKFSWECEKPEGDCNHVKLVGLEYLTITPRILYLFQSFIRSLNYSFNWLLLFEPAGDSKGQDYNLLMCSEGYSLMNSVSCWHEE